MALLEVKKVSKNYGKLTAVHEVSFSLPCGVYGLIGENGAGKSTLMKMITTTLTDYEGTILYDGQEITSMKGKYRSLIGYMPQASVGYGDFSALQFLYYMAALKGMKKKDARTRILELSRIVHLENDLKRKIKTYSGGMKQRLFFMQAILNDPKILILDEPTAGLDPLERIHLRNLIASLAKDKIILIATHVMQDIEGIANGVFFLQRGKIILEGSIEHVLEQLKGKLKEGFVADEDWEAFAQKHQITRSIREEKGMFVRYIEDGGDNHINPTLEDAYLYYMER